MPESMVNLDESTLDSIFAKVNTCHSPGAAVGIALNGRPVYSKGFGLANIELPIVLSPTIRMRIASESKHFTALAFMLLCEDGKARIDDPIGNYLPELHPITRQVTMRQLMGNIGGLRDAQDICYQFSGIEKRVSSAQALSLYRNIGDINAAPATAWIYNNGGWLMISVAIERIAGRSLEDVLRERIFEPVGMYSSMLRRWDTDFVPNSAVAHKRKATGAYEKSHLGTALAGEGGMVSTVHDMLRWLAHMDAPVVGTSTTWATLRAPQRLRNGMSTGYGLGLIVGRYRGVETLYHPGGLIGGNAHMLKVPSRALDVVIMVNRDDVSGAELVDRILDVCLLGLEPVEASYGSAVTSGTFFSPSTGRVIQLFGREGRQHASIDGYDMPTEADASGVLWPTGFSRYIKQGVTLIGDRGNPKSIRLCDFGNVDELVRQRPVRTSDASAIFGSYRSEETQTEATVCHTAEGAQLLTIGQFGSAAYSLECLGERIWRATSPGISLFGGILVFADSGFHFSSPNTRTLPFRRLTISKSVGAVRTF